MRETGEEELHRGYGGVDAKRMIYKLKARGLFGVDKAEVKNRDMSNPDNITRANGVFPFHRGSIDRSAVLTSHVFDDHPFLSDGKLGVPPRHATVVYGEVIVWKPANQDMTHPERYHSGTFVRGHGK